MEVVSTVCKIHLYFKSVQECPEDIVKVLAEDEDWDVHVTVVERKQDLPKNVLGILAEDKDR